MSKRKFKLLKWYPSLPNDWEEGDVVVKGNELYLLEDVGDKKNRGVLAEHVENNPEFWQEITGEPLFVTEDGVEKYEGDHYYYVRYQYKNKLAEGSVYKNGIYFDSVKRFHSKEKAEEYIAEHKPRYSRADIRKALSNIMEKENVLIAPYRDIIEELENNV